MPYNDFTLERVRDQFGAAVQTEALFPNITPQLVSAQLQATLDDQVPIALASLTEKARSELIITPILVEVWRLTGRTVTLFSGVTFDVAPQDDLVGICDFMIVGDAHVAVITAPIIAIVEAKNDDMRAGLGQCAAELVVAHRYNQERGHPATVYGVVITGTVWRFLRYDGMTIVIDPREEPLDDLVRILGIFTTICAG